MRTTNNWEAVAVAIHQRMVDLGISQRELAKRSGLSPATVRELQCNYAERRRPARTMQAVSVALQWPRDHLTAILRGEAHPTGAPPVADQILADQPADILTQLKDVKTLVRALLAKVESSEPAQAPVSSAPECAP